MVSAKASGHHHCCADAASAPWQTTKDATEVTTRVENRIARPRLLRQLLEMLLRRPTRALTMVNGGK